MAKKPAKKPAAAPTSAAPRLEKGELPEGEHFVAMVEYRGMIHIATNRHLYLIAGRNRDRLTKMEFTLK